MKSVLGQLKQYKKDALCTMGFTMLEVIMEVLLPFITALIIDEGLERSSMEAGFACKLREGMYIRTQDYSFSNIDKFSTAGLVTRMTTDVTNVQNAFQMIIRIAVRAPLMLISSMIMCFLINRNLSLIFLVGLCFLAVILVCIMSRAIKVFQEVFDRYDDLNAILRY